MDVTRYIDIGEGCFRDPHRIYIDSTGKLFEAGKPYLLEFTPTLNQDEASIDECISLMDGCSLLGGNWIVPEPHELAGLLDFEKYNPASTAPDTRSDLYWTKTPWAPNPSDCAVGVAFYGGSVGGFDRSYYDFARACRRVAAGQ